MLHVHISLLDHFCIMFDHGLDHLNHWAVDHFYSLLALTFAGWHLFCCFYCCAASTLWIIVDLCIALSWAGPRGYSSVAHWLARQCTRVYLYTCVYAAIRRDFLSLHWYIHIVYLVVFTVYHCQYHKLSRHRWMSIKIKSSNEKWWEKHQNSEANKFFKINSYLLLFYFIFVAVYCVFFLWQVWSQDLTEGCEDRRWTIEDSKKCQCMKVFVCVVV